MHFDDLTAPLLPRILHEVDDPYATDQQLLGIRVCSQCLYLQGCWWGEEWKRNALWWFYCFIIAKDTTWRHGPCKAMRTGGRYTLLLRVTLDDGLVITSCSPLESILPLTISVVTTLVFSALLWYGLVLQPTPSTSSRLNENIVPLENTRSTV